MWLLKPIDPKVTILFIIMIIHKYHFYINSDIFLHSREVTPTVIDKILRTNTLYYVKHLLYVISSQDKIRNKGELSLFGITNFFLS